MLRKNQRILNFLNALSDGVIVLCAYLFSTWLWLDVISDTYHSNMAAVRSLREGMGLAAAFYALAMVLMLAIFRMYNPSRIRRLRVELVRVWGANALGILGVAALLFLFRLQEFSRGVLGIFFLTSSMLLCVKRVCLRSCLSEMRRRGYNQKHVIVVGTGVLAAQYAHDVEKERYFGFHIKGFVGEKRDGLPWLGGFEDLEGRLQGSDVDEVIVALEPEDTEWIRPIISTCEKCGTKVSVVPFYNNIIPANPTIEIIGGTKLINLRSNPLDNLGYAAIKRAFDILVSAVLLIVLSPFLLFVAAGIKLSSPGPVLFKQQRVGRNKRRFTMLKFRSMRVNVAQDTAWTTDNDPRKTRFGSFLRKLSIDELPQLMNVFRGDMSLIGPRPEIPFYVERFKESVPLYMVKHQVRPGMTGWAQVNGYRGDTSIVKRIEYDIWYIEHWSIGLDVKILLMTAFGGWMNRERLADARRKARAGESEEHTA